MNTMKNGKANHTRRKDRLLKVSTYHHRKALVDRCLACVLLLLTAPLMVALMGLVRLTSSGAAIYRQVRVGRHGKTFQLYKIRTMFADAEALRGPQWATRDDPRISPIGRALRFLHLDELPQLVNVVRGDMSLVGPRPERPEFVAQLALEVPNYRDRLAVLPGITGLAQINLPPDESLDSVHQKVFVDRQYIAQASALLDLRILTCTALRMLGIRHGRAARWLGVECPLPASELHRRSMVLDLPLPLAEAVVEDDRPLVNGSSFTNGSLNGHGKEAAAYVLAAVPANGTEAASEAGRDLPRRPR